GNEPREYAEAILKICRLSVESPAACVSGVTGGNLKRRIEAIMRNRSAPRLTRSKSLLVAAAGVAALAGPLVIGMSHAPAAYAGRRGAGAPSRNAAGAARRAVQAVDPPGS